ncbi:VIT domain-containing protein [Pseudorhodoferax sp. Leaf274]|uniref:VIT domain-containing protein n=1 Tax=Pseudorhodoferax sp. Leaf274 TaxID=1736318 RepID=UPI000AB10FDD|nr:VIT domain-containing protein [Pseudorhodoferax sp. Leaf274]
MIAFLLLPQSATGRWLAAAALALCAALLHRPAYAQPRDADGPRQQTESPYFVVRGGAPGTDALPLKGTEVSVQVSGVIAEVRVVQHYRNEGQQAIEADYVFPGSTRAAVGGLQVRLGERLVTAQIREKQQARIEYATAKQEGKTAALLEQQRPNVFQMRVANILPGDDVRVELRYTELLLPQDGRYAFVFPTVVGPRYAHAASQGQDTWAAQPTLRAGEPPASRFTLQMQLDAPLPLRAIRSRTHAIAVEQPQDQPRHASVRLAEGSGPANDRDFVLDYSLAGDQLAAGLMLSEGQGPGAENFFLALVAPPQAVAATQIAPREYIFVVDISGSMHGFPLDTAKAMLQRLIGGLRAGDRFNVLLFSGSSRMLAPRSVPATQANIDRALAALGQTQGAGGTELIPALRRVYAEPKTPDVARTIVVVTDGYVSVEQEAFALVRQHLNQANLFAFGIGSSVNRALLEGLARAGGGEPFIITDPVQAPGQAARFRRMVESPVLTGVRLQFEGLDVYDLEPAVQPDVLGERPVVVFGKWRGQPQGRMRVLGHTAAGPWQQAVEVQPAAAGQASALPALWARHRIAQLTDQEALEGGDAQRAAITRLGLDYALLTPYTSFIAIDQVVRNLAPHDSQRVQQPQPLPQGVGERALGESATVIAGAEVPSTPEPETLGAVLLVLSVLAMLQRRARRTRSGSFTQ